VAKGIAKEDVIVNKFRLVDQHRSKTQFAHPQFARPNSTPHRHLIIFAGLLRNGSLRLV
jgi:hypothetical protein